MRLLTRALSFLNSIRKTRATVIQRAFAKAEGGDIRAQYDLGERYHDGLGVSRDFAEAFGWFRRAAEQGDSKAQLNVGMMYFLGRGVPRDPVEALKWISLAAAQGSEAAVAARETAAKRLTPEERVEAQLRAARFAPVRERA